MIEKLVLDQLAEATYELRLFERHYGVQNLVRKFASKHCSNLRNFTHRRGPVQSSHQRILQGIWDLHFRERTLQDILGCILDQAL